MFVRMPEQTALFTHKAVKAQDPGCFICLVKFHRFSDGNRLIIRRIIRDQQSGSPDDLDPDPGVFIQDKMVDIFRGIAESKADPHLEQTLGNASVIGGTAVNA